MATSASPLTDLRSRRSTLAGWALMAAAAALVAGALVRPNLLEGGEGWQRDAIAADPALALLSAGLFALAGYIFFAAAVGIATAAGRGRGSRWLFAGAWAIALLGAYCFAARTVFMVMMHGIATSSITPDAGRAAVEAMGDSPGGLFLMPIFVGGLVVGPPVLAVGVWRAGAGPWWPALLWIAGFLVYSAFEWTGILREGIGWLMMGAALVWLGALVMRLQPDARPVER